MKQSIHSHSERETQSAATAVARAQRTQSVTAGDAAIQNKLVEAAQHSPQSIAQRALDARLNDSPRMAVQRKQMEDVSGQSIQRAGVEEEEPLQGKFEAVQRAGVEEEEPLQGKFDPVQRAGVEEEEPLQGKFDAIQRAGVEEEEPLQGKFDPVQRAGVEEEEPLQGKFDPVQRAGVEEEEPLQGKFEAVQRAGVEEEEPMQGKFAPAVQLKEAKPNNTGLPDNLKSGVESLSGIAMDDVKVHYNSSKPSQVQAHAYAQGTDIHVAPGQEQHLPHEAWHVAQQKQGRVQPTTQAKGIAINDDVSLEHEADVMGAKAVQTKAWEKS
jgi:hypothetical protein